MTLASHHGVSSNTRTGAPFALTGKAALLAVLLFALTFLDGCRSSQSRDVLETMERAKAAFRSAIEEAVVDPQRAAAALASWDTYEAHEAAFVARARELRAQLFELNADPESEREAFRVRLDALDAARTEFADQVVDDFASLREHVDPGEWTAVFEAVRELDGHWEDLVQ